MRSLSLCCVLCLQLFLFLSLSYYSFAFPSCRPDQAQPCYTSKTHFPFKKTLPSSFTSEVCDDCETRSSPKTSTWKNGTNCCLWDGVTCNPLGHVIGLNLNCSWLHGKLLPNNSLFQLIHLQRLNLSGNDFDGSQISSTFSQLDFNHLILKENTWERLTTNITQIKDLNLFGVDMSSIPSSHLFKNLSSSLVSLELAGVGLQGNLDEKIFSFPQLQEIYLGYNPNLIGHLPMSNWSNSIRALDLSLCQLFGELPPSFWNLTQLIYLDLSNNNFFGQISSSLSNLQNLTYLYLSSNNFSGQFPYSLSKLKISNL